MRLSRQGCPQELWQCHHPSLVPSRVSAKAFPQALRFIRCVLGKKPSSMSQCRGISPDPAVGKGRNPSGTIRIFPEITEEEWITSPDSEHEQSWTPPHPLPHHLGQSRHQNLITKDWTPSHKAQPLSKRLSWAGGVSHSSSAIAGLPTSSNGLAAEPWHAATAGEEPSPCY